jgi:hypothetical protein
LPGINLARAHCDEKCGDGLKHCDRIAAAVAEAGRREPTLRGLAKTYFPLSPTLYMYLMADL